MKGTFFAELLKIAAFVFLSLSLLYLSRRYSFAINHQLLSFSIPSPETIAPSANTDNFSGLASAAVISSVLRAPSPPRDRTGIVDESGAMTVDFEVGEVDPDLGEVWEGASGREGGESEKRRSGVGRINRKYKVCEDRMREYVPCLDNVEAIKRLNSTERGEKYERHCPNEEEKRLDCSVPRPKGYRTPVPWPQSRDAVWVSNVQAARLVEEKKGQNQVSVNGDKLAFSGGGTQFVHGEEQYLDHILTMVPDLSFGHRTRVALDIDCGVASFGAFLMQRNVTTLSIAQKDVHKNQVQLALERGVPAMLGVFATHRLLFPSQAFDLIHCSSCRVNWIRDDGILLLEVNRMLRAGGYFVWVAQTVYEHDENLQGQWKEMENLTSLICWDLVKKDGDIAIWRKPINNSCYVNRHTGVLPPLCDPNDDLDNVWYVGLNPCIARLPENGYGGNFSTWPARLHYPPDRLQSIVMDAYMSRKEIFRAESKYWKEIIEGYVRAYHWKESKLRNVMDMRAVYGGFAAALHDLELNSWVMNVVPVSGFNTLPVIYDRGLIGVMHDWCEPFDTYPRTYDLLHAMGLFSVEQKRCNMSTIVLEMDRILRPGGHAYIRDSLSVMGELQELATAVGWVPALHDTAEGPLASWKILRCEKRI